MPSSPMSKNQVSFGEHNGRLKCHCGRAAILTKSYKTAWTEGNGYMRLFHWLSSPALLLDSDDSEDRHKDITDGTPLFIAVCYAGPEGVA